MTADKFDLEAWLKETAFPIKAPGYKGDAVITKKVRELAALFQSRDTKEEEA